MEIKLENLNKVLQILAIVIEGRGPRPTLFLYQ